MVKFLKYTGFPVLCGIVIGMMIASLTSGISALSWLSFGLNLGMTSPLVIDLSLLKFTFALSVNLNVATIICVTLCLIAAKYIYKR